MAENQNPWNVGVDAQMLIDDLAAAVTRAFMMKVAPPALVARMQPHPPPPPAAAASVHNMKAEKFPPREYKIWHDDPLFSIARRGQPLDR